MKNVNSNYVMIIGAMKSGTGSLFMYLKDHPEICPCRVKEPEYFSKLSIDEISLESYDKLFFYNSEIHKYKLEASTGYTKYPMNANVPKKIYSLGIKPKLIYIVRNPLDRIDSHYNFMRNKVDWNLKITSEHLVNVSKYYSQLEQFKPYASKDDLLILDFDDLKNEPKKVLKDVYDFLDISDDYYPENFGPFNVTKIKNRTELKIKSKYSPIFNFIPKPIKVFLLEMIRKLFPSKKMILSKNRRDSIFKQLKDDMQKFQSEYDFDTKKWGF